MPTIQEILQTLSTGLVPGASSAAGALNQTGAQMPDIGMPGITVRGPSQAQAAPQLPPQTPGMTQSPNPGMASPLPFPPPQEETQGGSNPIFDILKALAIPLATTGVGLGIPGALPGAAGFQSGFTGEQAEQRRLGEEKELVQERELVKVPGKERKEILDLRKRAESATLNLLKTGILGSMKEVSPEEFKRMSDVMFKLMSPQGKLAKELGDEAISKATKKSSGGKASRANEIRKENPSLSREEIINMVNKEFTR